MTKKRLQFFLIVFCLLTSKLLTAEWVNMNTGIIDNFNAVYFWNNNGLLAGDKGLYYTTTGGNGAASWKRFTITGNSTDLALYNNCKFSKIDSKNANQAYVCGWDAVNNKSVILYIDISNLSYSFKYIGAANSKLNDIKCSSTYLYSVGDKGLIVRSDFSTFQPVSSPTAKNLLGITMNGPYFSFAGDNILVDGYDGGTGFTATAIDYPGISFKDIASVDANHCYEVGKTFYYTYDATTTTEINTYKFGSLEGKSIFIKGDAKYIGTNHGIFVINPNFAYLELQPSSANYDVNDIQSDGFNKAYAACANGVLLSTENGGYPAKPYAALNMYGTCINDDFYLVGTKGGLTACTWLINDSVVSTECYPYHKFTKAGKYDITYIVKDELSDTVKQTIYFVDPPIINLPTSLSKAILCHQDSTTIFLQNSQKDFTYQLKKFNDNKIYGSASGNGGQLAIKTGLLTEATFFYIHVQSQLATCERDFTDTIKIGMEKTRADFDASLINATALEKVDFFQKCTDAQHYRWTFSPSASPFQDSGKNPTGIEFKTLGATNVKLVTWSDLGCYDSIVKGGPFIYVEPVGKDSCWAFNLDGNDPNIQRYSPDIAQQILTPDGYLIAGTFYQCIFKSRSGNSFGRTKQGGAYIAKYSRNGVLKWVDQGISSSYENGDRPFVSSIVRDPKSGNIYATGLLGSGKYFYSNSGDSVKLNHLFGNNFIMKLNSAGRLLWASYLESSYQPDKIKLDKAGDLVIMGSLNDMTYLYKLDTNGVTKWGASFSYVSTNPGTGGHDFDIDGKNNILITGGIEHSVTFYSANSPVIDTLTDHTGGYGPKLYVVKYSPDGEFIWRIFGHLGNAYTYAIVADSAGNSYVSGYNSCADNSNCFVITNADKSIFKASVGAYFLLKTDPSGKSLWANGSQLAYYGFGYSIASQKDEISVLGNVRNNSLPWSGTMTSTDGKNLYCKIASSDLFIATYTTSGILKSVISTGPNEDRANLTEGFSLLRDEPGNFLLSGNLSNFSNVPPYQIGPDAILANGTDGIMAKMSKNGCNSIVTETKNKDVASQSTEVNIHPNPVTENVLISLKNVPLEYDLKIYNALGACIYSKRMSASEFTLNKKEFGAEKTGLYFMNFMFNDQTLNFSTKIMIVD